MEWNLIIHAPNIVKIMREAKLQKQISASDPDEEEDEDDDEFEVDEPIIVEKPK